MTLAQTLDAVYAMTAGLRLWFETSPSSDWLVFVSGGPEPVVAVREVGWRAWSAMQDESGSERPPAVRVRVIRERAAAFRRHPLGYRP